MEKVSQETTAAGKQQMTPNQKKALDYLKMFWKRNGHSPSYREMSYGINIGVSYLYEIMNGLHRKGFIHIDRGTVRGIYPMEVWNSLRGEEDVRRKEKDQAKTEEPQEETGS